MNIYSFSLIVEGVPETDEGFSAFTEALFPHAPDSTPSAGEISFDREATSLREAIASAIESVHQADPSIAIVGIVMEDGQPIDAVVAVA
jgi:hypothetical protein